MDVFQISRYGKGVHETIAQHTEARAKFFNFHTSPKAYYFVKGNSEMPVLKLVFCCVR